MAKNRQKISLNTVQRQRINTLHRFQIALEIVLITIFFILLTYRLVANSVAYGIFVLVASLLGVVALFVVGLLITIYGSNISKLGAPLDKYSKALSVWIRVDWFYLPGLLLGSMLVSGLPDYVSTTVNVILLIGFASSLVATVVVIHRMWAHFTKKRNHKLLRSISYGAVVLVTVLVSVFGTYTTVEVVKHGQTAVSESSLEIDQTEVRQQGRDGEKRTVYNLVLGVPIDIKTTDATDEIIAKGTSRFQYMYCSDGSYRYYTSEQMQVTTVGFTHRSPDGCAENNQGTQTALSNTPPPKTQVTYVPTYTAPRSTITNCSSLTGYSITCYSY